MLQVALDATPLLGRRAGIGRYTEHLVRGLATRPDVEVTCVPFTVRRGGPVDDLPAGVRWQHRPAPARGIRRLWGAGLPLPVEVFGGRNQVFHGTNFVLPPHRAAGVVTIHDLTYLRHPEWVSASTLDLGELVPRGLAKASRIFTPSAAVRDELLDAYPGIADRTMVTSLGVDPIWSKARPLTPDRRQRLGLPAEYFVWVGTLEPRKGLDHLVRAHQVARQLEPELPPMVLVGARGWGEVETDPGFFTPGFVEDDDLMNIVAGARAFVFPTRYEGFGLPPLEALAAGVPVIASDLPVMREVLGRHAHFTPVGDVEALADALIAAAGRSPGSGDQEAGRAHAARLTWQRCVDTTVDGYRQAVADPR